MRPPRLFALTAPALLAGTTLVAASCAAPATSNHGKLAVAAHAPEPRAATPARPRPGTSGALLAEIHERRAARAKTAPPAPPPPPRVTTPLAGEPRAEQLAQARLVRTSCDAIGKEIAEARVKKLREDIHASYMNWHAEQPACWERDRAQDAERRQNEADAARGESLGYGYGSGGTVSASFGAGGLGLSGVGEGGGGRGVGVGRGAVGHMWGHGHGRLSGSHKAGQGEPAKARRASGTNNQVDAVDEADLVKTDGRWVYLATNGALRIVEAMNPRIVSVTKIAGTVREMFVSGDRAVVYASTGARPRERCTYGYDCAFAGDASSTSITVFDVTDRARPRVTRTLKLSGALVSARRIGGAIHTVVSDGDAPSAAALPSWPDDLEMCGTPEAVVKAKLAKLQADGERRIRAEGVRFASVKDGETEVLGCDTLLRTRIRDGNAFTTLVSFDISADGVPPVTATVQSRPGAVFASADALYMAVVHRREPGGAWYGQASDASEVSEIHKFRIGDRPGETRYAGSGTVPGHVLNQFAMDEWYGYLRVATTRGRVPDPKVSSVVSVLAEVDGGNLARVGAINGIAPGEDIRAVRFEGERGYVVTFKKTDPLFVMDLGDPARPRITGELKIPGFSTYMHRIDRDHLLSIGFDANDKGSFAFFDGILLQLFDIKDPATPRLLHKERIGTRGSSSQAATDHLAFNFVREEGLLAVPMTICEGGGDGTFGKEVAFSGLLLYDVDVERGFTRLGGVDHADHAAKVSCNTWWSHATSAVKRSVFLDDLVYSIAPERAKVQRLGQLGTDVADLHLGF
jgi:hypothetical protein